MPSEKKLEEVKELRERIERAAIVIAANYRGLGVTDMVKLRSVLRGGEGVEMRVVKNRLFIRASEEAEQPELAQLVDGPTAIIFGYDDVTVPVRLATEYIKDANNEFSLRMGVMTGQVLTEADLKDLASLPSKEVLIGMLAGALQAPITNLVGLFGQLMPRMPGRLLQDSFTTFNGLLEARANQLEAEAA